VPAKLEDKAEEAKQGEKCPQAGEMARFIEEGCWKAMEGQVEKSAHELDTRKSADRGVRRGPAARTKKTRKNEKKNPDAVSTFILIPKVSLT